MDYPKAILPKVKEFLGQDGCKFFVEVMLADGDLISTHFREGMQVRNFLRSLPEFKDWGAHELDDSWMEIVVEAIVNGS